MATNLIRLGNDDRKVLQKALFEYAKRHPREIWECFILSKAIHDRPKGPRRRWAVHDSDEDMFRQMQSMIEEAKQKPIEVKPA